MIRVMFVCLGNICRSPMAEVVFKNMVQARGVAKQFEIASAATSTEEIGNPVHPGTRKKLAEVGLSAGAKRAVQLRQEDYARSDYLLGMERSNLRAMERIAGGDPQHKMHRLLDFSDHPRDIADPWYTGDFETTYRDICEGCQAFLATLITG